MRPVGFAGTLFNEISQVPKGRVAKHEAEGSIEIDPEGEQGLADVKGFSHRYVIWVFHASQGYDLTFTSPTEDRPHGVFATRSPRLPNPPGLTMVRLLGREGRALRVRGLDRLDGTPVLDIKPYLLNVPESELRRGQMNL
jgi:tRNA-Thr(GGU) m(6)t(6)A37 methyltransferase TsaA